MYNNKNVIINVNKFVVFVKVKFNIVYENNCFFKEGFLVIFNINVLNIIFIFIFVFIKFVVVNFVLIIFVVCIIYLFYLFIID